MASPEQRISSDHLIHDVTIENLQQLTDIDGLQWNWTTYLESVFEDTNITIDADNDHVIIMDLQYLQKLPELLAETSSATIGNQCCKSSLFI